MGAAIVTGAFSLVLALVTWALTNGSRKNRILSRIGRQATILKDLPSDHPARAPLDEALREDVAVLLALVGSRSEGDRTETGGDGAKIGRRGGGWRRTSPAFVATLTGAVVAAVLTIVLAVSTLLADSSKGHVYFPVYHPTETPTLVLP